jgi:predicted DNA-binding transcriptional regulator AlpA
MSTTLNHDITNRELLEPLLTTRDLMRILRVDKRTIARMCERGQLARPVKIGCCNRWRARQIEELISGVQQRRLTEA